VVQTDKQTSRQIDKQTNRQADKQTNRQKRQKDKQTNRQKRKKDKQTNRQKYLLLVTGALVRVRGQMSVKNSFIKFKSKFSKLG
jgi:hypothetical protein